MEAIFVSPGTSVGVVTMCQCAARSTSLVASSITRSARSALTRPRHPCSAQPKVSTPPYPGSYSEGQSLGTPPPIKYVWPKRIAVILAGLALVGGIGFGVTTLLHKDDTAASSQETVQSAPPVPGAPQSPTAPIAPQSPTAAMKVLGFSEIVPGKPR